MLIFRLQILKAPSFHALIPKQQNIYNKTYYQQNTQIFLNIDNSLYLLIYIPKIQAMILNMQQTRGFVNLPIFSLPWDEQFRKLIIDQHKQSLDQQRRKIDESYKKYQARESHGIEALYDKVLNESKQLSERRRTVISVEPSVHVEYSNFVPLKNLLYEGKNQCTRQFAYVQYLNENNYKIQLEQFYEDLSKSVCNFKQSRLKLLNKYNPSINFTARLNLYRDLLCFGSKVLSKFEKTASIIHNICSLESYLPQNWHRMNQNLNVSIQKKQVINLSTISYTMKSLYCPICLLFDCNRHETGYNLKQDDNNLMDFVSQKNQIQKQQHIQYAIKMLNKAQQYLGDRAGKDQNDEGTGLMEDQNLKQNQNQANKCSQDCYIRYKTLTKDVRYCTKLTVQLLQISDITKSLIEMGAHIYSYQPCLIKKLIPNQCISCCGIFQYLETNLRVEQRIMHKMSASERQFLLNQQSSTQVPNHANLINKKRAKLKTNPKKLKKAKKSKNLSASQRQKPQPQVQPQCQRQQIKPAICKHHFLSHSPSTDKNCINCICNQRGFCLPQCLCSQQSCTLMMIGCKCKKNKNGSCQTNNCPCFINRVQCIVGICGKNCCDKQGSCMNKQVQLSKGKRLKIGISGISGAGLGLFAVQNITKGSLVTVYLGEKIQSEIGQLRQILRKNDSFYNFQCQQYYLDSRFFGNKSRFINHNNPKQINLNVKIIKIIDQSWIAFYAARDIEAHQQLYFDYDGDGQLAKHHAKKYPFIVPK